MSSGDLLGNQAGGLDNRTLDSLYNDALRRNNQNASYDPWEPALGGNMMQPTMHNPFFASNTIAAPPSVQMASRERFIPYAMVNQDSNPESLEGSTRDCSSRTHWDLQRCKKS
ncbi:hypothetical protein JHK84_027710 [Glycine max]|nr:hypothetical protein JHK84_027710 [Glycine max]